MNNFSLSKWNPKSTTSIINVIFFISLLILVFKHIESVYLFYACFNYSMQTVSSLPLKYILTFLIT